MKPTFSRSVLALVLALVFAIAQMACSDSSTKPDSNDPCGNAIGNGNQVISGPAAAGSPFEDQVFRSLEVDPSDAEIIFVGTEYNGIVMSSDGGATWQRLRRGLRHSTTEYCEVWDIRVSPADPMRVIAATTNSPGPPTGGYPSAIGGFYASADGGLNWSRGNCGLPNASTSATAYDPSNPARIVLGVKAGRATFSDLLGQVFAGGLFWSDDFGAGWTAAAAPAGADRNEFWVIRARGSALYTFGSGLETAGSLGFLKSRDGGRSWAALAEPLRERRIVEFDVSTDGLTIVANERDRFQQLRSTDGGASWDTLLVGGQGPLAISPADAGIVLYDDNGRLRRSVNGLATVSVVLESARRFDDIAFAPSNPMVVYAATEFFDIWRSDDAGATWRKLVNLRTDGVIH